jgi:hypothetical protein
MFRFDPYLSLYMKSFAEAQRVLLQLVGTKNVEAQINVAEESPPEQ